jgi:hypothetical protein
MMLAPPASDVVTPPLVDTLAIAGSDELQVKKVPVTVAPKVSSTVAVMVFEPPLATITGLLLLPFTVNVIDCTGQVMKLTGKLFTPLMLAKTEVIPGVSAVACIWPGSNPLIGLLRAAVLSVTTAPFRVCQLKGPTVAVTSVPRLRAVA